MGMSSKLGTLYIFIIFHAPDLDLQAQVSWEHPRLDSPTSSLSQHRQTISKGVHRLSHH